MRSFVLLVAAFMGLATAQRNPTLDDVANIAKNAKLAAGEYLRASHAGSFLEERPLDESRTSFLAPVVRPLIARMMGESGGDGQYERKTQSPMVFLHLHHA